MKTHSLRLALLVLGGVLILMLAACDAFDDDDDDESAADTQPDTAADLIDAGEESGRLETVLVSFDTTGAPNVTVDPVETDVWAVQQINDAYFITIDYPASNILITLENIPADLTTGTYPLGTTDADGGLAATLRLGPGADVEWFGRSTAGSLNVLAINEGRITGSFTFEATQTLDDGDAQTTITATGQFDSMPLP